MGQSLLSTASIALKLKLPAVPTSFFPTPIPKISSLRRNLQTKALLSETKYPKVAAQSTGPIPAAELLRVVETAAEAGAEVHAIKIDSFLTAFCAVFDKLKGSI